MADTPVTANNPMSIASGYEGDVHANNYWTSGNIIGDWLGHQDTFAHNEALAAWQRESTFNAQEAQKARDFEKMMADTQMQRKVADLMHAGFSPLAALESNGSYAVSSAPAAAAHAKAAQNSGNGFGAMLSALIMTIANFATKGMASAAVSTANASKAANDAQRLDILRDKLDIQRDWLDLAKNGRSAAKAAAQKVIRHEANDHHSYKGLDWDKMLDELDKY